MLFDNSSLLTEKKVPGENIPVTTQIGKNLPSNPQGFSGYTER